MNVRHDSSLTIFLVIGTWQHLNLTRRRQVRLQICLNRRFTFKNQYSHASIQPIYLLNALRLKRKNLDLFLLAHQRFVERVMTELTAKACVRCVCVCVCACVHALYTGAPRCHLATVAWDRRRQEICSCCWRGCWCVVCCAWALCGVPWHALLLLPLPLLLLLLLLRLPSGCISCRQDERWRCTCDDVPMDYDDDSALLRQRRPLDVRLVCVNT